jgi:hypothetical protein
LVASDVPVDVEDSIGSEDPVNIAEVEEPAVLYDPADPQE